MKSRIAVLGLFCSMSCQVQEAAGPPLGNGTVDDADDPGTVPGHGSDGGPWWGAAGADSGQPSEEPGEDDPTPRQPFDEELLVNGDFESGGLNGWTLVGGACTVTDGVDWLDPAEGEWMLWGGEAAGGDCFLAQRVDLIALGFDPDTLDSGTVLAQAEAWLASTSLPERYDDQSRLRLHFMDADGQTTGMLEPLIGTGSEWLARAAEGIVPRHTRTIQLELLGRLRQGADCDALADDISLRLRPVEPASPGITKLPMLQDHRQDAMRIIWETDGNLAESQVRWGALDNGLARKVAVVRTIEVDPDHYVHIADIEGLQPGQVYQYAVGTGDTWTRTWTFRTAPPDDGDVSIAWVADNQDGPQVFRRHVRHMAARQPDLLVVPGDIIEHATVASEWADYWWEPLSDSGFAQTTPVLVARGNHDAEHPYAYAYTALPGNEAWYSFRYGSVFVVVLDSGGPSTQAELPEDQVRFIRASLDSDDARTADFRVVTMHVAPFTNTNKDDGSTGDSRARQDWVDLFVDGGVDLVIAGHYHSYQRGQLDGVTYVVVGGGGGVLDGGRTDAWPWLGVIDLAWHYSLMDVEDGRLQWTTRDLFDNVIDEFTLFAD